jgi:hypothetical protein
MVRASSEIASNMFQDESLDFVYIDANHAYDFVKQDIELWYPKVKKGGYLWGHDYIDLNWYNDPNFAENNNFINPKETQSVVAQSETGNLKPMMLPKFDNVFKKSPFSFLSIDLDLVNEVFKDIKLNKIFIDGGAKSNRNVIGIELN